MTWQNLVALAVFVGVCGFIAYWGDVLGRRMGKRRLSLFGLRPRHTAIVTTTITGMLIAILTITSLAIVNKEFQLIILRGHQIVREYETAREKYNQVTKQLVGQRRIAGEATEKAREAVSKGELLAAEIRRVDRNLKKLTSQLDRSKADLARTEKTLGTTHKELGIATRELAQKQYEFRQQQRAIDDLKTRRAELEKELEGWMSGYSQLRSGTIIFRPNQDIARRVIQCAQPKSSIRAKLISLLDEASKTAEAEGAKVGKNGRAIQIRSVEFQGETRKHTESEIIGAIVDSIYSGSGAVVARIYAISNAFEGEQTVVDCQPIANRLIYLANDEVASTEIDGSLPHGQIFSSLVVFLRNDVSSAARHEGLIPKYTETGPSVGEIDDWNEVVDLVLKIKSAGKKVTVKAVAARETWSVGPMLVDFVISE